ncbi:MAG: hypothetical protein KDD40_10095, partial [Bdellovibrionales bacterium]|nr:hypothetical protein [Bdellovibrionales bacterium]
RKFSYDKDSQDQINEIIKTAQDEYVKIYETTHAKLQEGESLPGIEMLGEIAHRIVELEEGKNGLKNLYSNRNKNQKYSQAVRDIFTESRIDSVIKNSPTNPYKEQLLELMANPEADISQFINEEVQAYIIAEIDNKIKDKRSFEVSKRLKDLKDERHKKLDFIIQKIKEVKKAYSVESQNLWAKKAEAIDPDLGVSSIKDARWELSAAELTPEQRVQRSLQLQEFLAAVEVERRKIRNIVQAEMTENINNFNKNKMPQGFSSEIEVRHKLAYLKALKEKTYVPSVDSEYTQTLQMIVDEIHDVDKTMSELKFEKEKLSEEFNLKQLIKQRNDILKHLNKLFEDSHIADGSDKWPNREMPLWWSLDIKKKVERREKALMQWKEIEKDLTHLIQEYLVAKLETQGGFVPEDFKNIPENIQQGIVKYNEYRENFFNAKQEVLSAFLNSLRKGELPNPGAESIEEVPDFNNSQASINELLGQSDISVTPPIFDDNSLESKIREAETKWLILLQKESHLNARKDLLSYQYNQYLAKIAPDLITTHFTLVDVGQILTMGMDRVNELMSQPNSEIYEKALKQTIDDWDEKWKDIVNENQLANPDWYPLNPFLYRTARGKSH